MSKEQIEEMAREIFAPKVCIDFVNLAFASVHGADREDSNFMKIATHLFNAGYRKQGEGEWIVTDADSGSFGEYEPFIEFKCPKCESSYGIESGQYDWQYGEPIPWVACPLCGAKMKGGAEK